MCCYYLRKSFICPKTLTLYISCLFLYSDCESGFTWELTPWYSVCNTVACNINILGWKISKPSKVRMDNVLWTLCWTQTSKIYLEFPLKILWKKQKWLENILVVFSELSHKAGKKLMVDGIISNDLQNRLEVWSTHDLIMIYTAWNWRY